MFAKGKVEGRGGVGMVGGCGEGGRAALERPGDRAWEEGRSAGTPVSTEHAAWPFNTECGSVRDKSCSPLPIFQCPGTGALSAVTQAADCLHPGLEGLSLEARPGQEAGEPKRERWAGGEGPAGVAESLECKPAGKDSGWLKARGVQALAGAGRPWGLWVSPCHLLNSQASRSDYWPGRFSAGPWIGQGQGHKAEQGQPPGI